MDTATTTAAVAGGSALVAYLEARFHVREELSLLLARTVEEARFSRALHKKRHSLWYFFEERCQKIPNAECIWSREGIYTSRQVYDQSCRYAQWYLARGIKSGDLVALFMQNTPDFVFAWLGLWAIGCAPALINHYLGGDALLHCLKVARARLVLVDEEIKEEPLKIEARIQDELGLSPVILDAGLKRTIRSLRPERPADQFREIVRPSAPMCLLYTSGTTGMPKACVYPISRGYTLGRLPRTALGLKDKDRWYDCMPMYHGTGAISSVVPLLNGLTLCIGKKFSVSRFWKDVIDSRATWFTYVGETARYLLAAPPSPEDRQHDVRGMWGNGLRPDVWVKFRDRFGIDTVWEFFNSSEGVLALANRSRGDFTASAVGRHGLLSRVLLRNILVPVAFSIDSDALYRDPSTGFAVRKSYDEGGEILVKLDSAEGFPGYYNNPSGTASKLERNVFRKGDLYYRSGDALRRDDDGRWFFLDRLGDTYRWKSENVSTAAVAEVLGSYPGVVEANVYGVLVKGHEGRAGCAAIYIDPGRRASFNFKAFLQHTQGSLPSYAIPVFFRLVQALTPMHNNKQNKAPLRAEGIDLDKIAAGNSRDEMYWVQRKLNGELELYAFGQTEHRRLQTGQARL